ncbi:MAG: D-alanyl-D-alanine carboxypeptidase [Bacteroidales bacterium]|nr:D-alanyl-D-alanine carboxypeptidase [Bacteroidales bacterium]
MGSTEFDGASVSVLAVTVSGDTLLCADASRQCLSASNIKLITTGLALHALGSDYHFATSLGYDGFIEDGILHGDLYIIGGGDPTLGSDNPIAEPLDTLFSQWADLVREAGITAIDGYVIGDGRAISGMMEEGSWQLDDCGTYYGTGVCGLNFYENRLDFRVSAGAEEGRPLNISPIYPVMPWMTYSYACTTGAADSGNTLYYYTSNFAPFGEMRGTFAVNRGGKVEMAANKFPEYTVASYFVDFLRTAGIDCTYGPADLGYVFHPRGGSDYSHSETSTPQDGMVEPSIYEKFVASPQEELTIIGTAFSPELGKIVEVTNHDSNNMYAETLFRTIGRELGGKGTYEVAENVETELLEGLGVTDGNAVLIDGSGLSRKSHVSAAFLCSFLKAMTSSPAYIDFLASLPSPGTEGTLKSVMSSAPAATKQRIRMKSGSMDGIRCYSGYILPAGTTDDTIIFSILINNFSCPSTAIRRKIESIILLLTE